MGRSDKDIIEDAKKLAHRIEQNLLSASLAMAVLEEGNTKKIISKVSNTYEAHAYNIITGSLLNETILSLSRLIENGIKDRLNLEKAKYFLNNSEYQKVLKQNCPSFELKDFQDYCRAACSKLKLIIKKIQPQVIEFRNIHLAHSLETKRIKTMSYGELQDAIQQLISEINELLICLDGTSRDFEELNKYHKKYAKLFWKRFN